MKGSASIGVLMWAFGGFLTVALAAAGLNANTNANQDRLLTNHEGRIASVEADSKTTVARMDRLETKIDWLVQRQGGDPRTLNQLSESSSTPR